MREKKKQIDREPAWLTEYRATGLIDGRVPNFNTVTPRELEITVENLRKEIRQEITAYVKEAVFERAQNRKDKGVEVELLTPCRFVVR